MKLYHIGNAYYNTDLIQKGYIVKEQDETPSGYVAMDGDFIETDDPPTKSTRYVFYVVIGGDDIRVTSLPDGAFRKIAEAYYISISDVANIFLAVMMHVGLRITFEQFKRLMVEDDNNSADFDISDEVNELYEVIGDELRFLNEKRVIKSLPGFKMLGGKEGKLFPVINR